MNSLVHVLVTEQDFMGLEDLIQSWGISFNLIVIDQWCMLVSLRCSPRQALILALSAAGPVYRVGYTDLGSGASTDSAWCLGIRR